MLLPKKELIQVELGKVIIIIRISIYRIAGKFGRNYIWRFGLQLLKLNIGGI